MDHIQNKIIEMETLFEEFEINIEKYLSQLNQISNFLELQSRIYLDYKEEENMD